MLLRLILQSLPRSIYFMTNCLHLSPKIYRIFSMNGSGRWRRPVKLKAFHHCTQENLFIPPPYAHRMSEKHWKVTPRDGAACLMATDRLIRARVHLRLLPMSSSRVSPSAFIRLEYRELDKSYDLLSYKGGYSLLLFPAGPICRTMVDNDSLSLQRAMRRGKF